MKRQSGLSAFAGIFSAVLLLTGCDMTTPSQVETGHIRLQENMKTVTVHPAAPDAAAAARIAEDFKRNARGKMAMVIPYKAGQPAEELQAKRYGNQWKETLAKAGVREMDVSYVGVEDPQFLSRAVISYPALQALPPDGCRRLTGYQGADSIEDVHNYRIGCEVKTAVSKMIVDSEDLMGRESGTASEARRQGTVVEGYMSGTPNEPLEGGRSSDIGGE
jgi:type IV pilus biogenesis protein CpaD/CtpE